MCLVVIVVLSFYSFRQSLKHQSVIKGQLNHKDIITSLCEDILFSFQSCLQLAEQMPQSDMQVRVVRRRFKRALALRQLPHVV